MQFKQTKYSRPIDYTNVEQPVFAGHRTMAGDSVAIQNNRQLLVPDAMANDVVDTQATVENYAVTREDQAGIMAYFQSQEIRPSKLDKNLL